MSVQVERNTSIAIRGIHYPNSVHGSFSYTKDTHEAKLGPIELSVKEKETVNVPVWAGVGAIAVGSVLLLFGGKKS